MSTTFTIAKALECDLLDGYSILTGSGGLDREISRITVGEVPDLPKWLGGGELVLSTLFAFKDDRPGLKKFIYGLSNAGASGLCVKTSRFLNNIDGEIIDFCNKQDFPIINIKEDIRWSNLIQSLYEAKLSEKIQLETEMRMRGNLLDELLEGTIAADDEVLRRTSFLGFDSSGGCAAIVIDIDDFRELSDRSKSVSRRPQEEFYNYVLYAIKPLEQNYLAITAENNVVIFVNPGNKKKIDIIAKNLSFNISKRFPELTSSFGISEHHEKPLDMLKAYQQAALAAGVNAKAGAHGSITYFDQLGTYKLLLKLAETDPGELLAFYTETIAPLSDYDKDHDSELVKTLETYLTSEQNIAEAAAAMFLHRHTVRYRLTRIKDITGLDVLNSEDRERLSVGLKAMRLLSLK